MVTAKQRAASKRNIKKAQAARKRKARGTRRTKKSTRRRSPVAKKKGKKRGRKRGNRRKSNRKPVKRGLLGKLGASIMAIGPPTVAGLEASQAAVGVGKSENLNMISTVDYGFRRFLNNLTNGFVGKEAFTQSVGLSKKDGSRVSVPIKSGVEAGSLLVIVGTGAIMMAVDWGMSFLTGNRETKIIGTNMTATGTR